MTEPKTSTEGGDKPRVPRCPSCGRPRVHEFRPFCSARCRDVDLARWFSGAYAVPAVEDDGVFEDEGEPGRGRPSDPD